MPESGNHSVTLLLDVLRSPGRTSDPAAAKVWNRYASTLLQHAHKRMSQRLRQRVGAEDVVQQAYATFCKRFQRGEYEVGDRDDLLRLLIGITGKKVLLANREHNASKRSVGREHSTTGSEGEVIDLAAVEAGPADAVVFDEQLQRALQLLEGEHRLIASLYLEEVPVAQIAARLDVSVRTVQRKYEFIVKFLREQMADAEGPSE